MIKILNVRGDHIETLQNEIVVDYAIGHLPQAIQKYLKNRGKEVFIVKASASTRSALGITKENAIEDVKEDNPFISSIALSFINEMSSNPLLVINSYLENALKISEVVGGEKLKDNIEVQYKSLNHCLHVFCNTKTWKLSGNRLLLKKQYPETICSGAAGRYLKEFVEHDMLPNNARIIQCETRSQGIEIVFTYEEVCAKMISH